MDSAPRRQVDRLHPAIAGRRRAACTCAVAFAFALAFAGTAAAFQEGSTTPARTELREQEPAARTLVPEGIRPAFEERLAQLNSRDWQDRADAAAWLRTADIPNRVFEQLLTDLSLTWEQRHQLASVLRDRIISADPGAIGIIMSEARGALGIIIEQIVPGMPAEEAGLRIGDRITEVNGTIVLSSDVFLSVISTYQPGEEVILSIYRDERDAGGANDVFLEIPIVLARTDRYDHEYHSKVRSIRLRRVNDLIQQLPQPPELAAPTPGSRVQHHPAIRALKAQLALIEAERRLIPPQLQAEWRRIAEDLRAAISEPGLDDTERQFRLQVYREFLELLPD